jgi:hypothetical protein
MHSLPPSRHARPQEREKKARKKEPITFVPNPYQNHGFIAEDRSLKQMGHAIEVLHITNPKCNISILHSNERSSGYINSVGNLLSITELKPVAHSGPIYY